MDKTLRSGIFVILAIFVLFIVPSFAADGRDNCAEEGIAVENLTMLDLWYKKNDGDCFIWVHGHVFFIMPGDNIKIFSDLTCKTPYCKKNPTYKVYKSVDTDGNCSVRILPDCDISDN
jgi:hypothetical protein